MNFLHILDDKRRSSLARGVRRRFRSFIASRLDLVASEKAWSLAPAVDLRALGLDSEEVVRRAQGARFIIDIPLADCRGQGMLAFPCVPGAGHPMVETARLLLDRPDLTFEATPLCSFYDLHQPQSAADHLGLHNGHAELDRSPAVAAFPWAAPAPPDEEARRRRLLAQENEKHGADFGPEDGFCHFGPISRRRGAFELDRLRRVLFSIREDGFRFGAGEDGLCAAHLLVDGADRRALIQSGQHRIAALAALGYETAPLWLLPRPIRRNEAGDWLGVRAGVFTVEQGLAVFDRVFAGRQPEPTRPAAFEARSSMVGLKSGRPGVAGERVYAAASGTP
jgi:hypothetical protein